ncbi:hypothetical protein BA6E_101205 [Bacteroidales bacterium 6E]|nr:hypothetical protein BA6E_101205 [Bacteroidales bacterium 6E]
MKTYSRSDLDKIGNAIIYLAERIPDLSKTKLLKLLYLLEETYVKKYQLPFLNLEFEVWQAGPVARDIFIDLSDEPNLLKEYIRIKKKSDGTYIKPVIKFSDDEFSDNEIEMLDLIIEHFGSKTAAELVNRTHQKNSNWYAIAKSKGLLELFKEKMTNSSDEKIDLTWYLDDKGKQIFTEQSHFNRLISHIND